MVRPIRWAQRVALGLLVVAVGAYGYAAIRVWHAARGDARPPSDAILVLGASQFDGRPSEIFEARLRHAKALYDAGVAAHVVTVGGNQPGDRFTEGGAGARYLGRLGVPQSALVPVERGNDTLSSLQAAARVFADRGWRSVVLVTDPWHELRSRAMASDLGLQAHASPTRTGPSVQGRLTEVHYVAREALAYLYYEVFHRSVDSGLAAA